MGEFPKVYVDNPVHLDLYAVGVKPLDDTEIFIEHPKYRGYFISTYGRCYSSKSKKVLIPQMVGSWNRKNQMRPSYKLYDDKGQTHNIRVSKLVADLYIANNYPATQKTVIHHRNGDSNHYSNLERLSYQEHSGKHMGKPVRYYDIANSTTVDFESISELCRQLSLCRTTVSKAINKSDYFCADGDIVITEVKGAIYNNQPVYIGYKKSTTKESDTSQNSTIIVASVIPYASNKAV